MSDNIRVEFAYPYVDRDGKNHNADASASLPREEARELIAAGRARLADPKAPAANAKKEQ